MKLINSLPQEGGQPSFLGYSRGSKAPTSERAVKSSQATIIEGFANIIPVAAKTGDIFFDNKIGREAEEGVDGLTDEFIQQFTGVSPSTGELSVPDEINQSGTQMERMTQAFKRGKIKDSYYWARMDTIARTLKTRYPGHRDIIDRKMSGLTGSVPANALQRALRNEARSEEAQRQSASTSGEKRRQGLIDDATKKGILNTAIPGFSAREQSNDPYTLDEMRYHLDRFNAVEAGLKRRESVFDFNKKQGDKRTEDLEKIAMERVQVALRGNVDAVLSPMGKSYKDFENAAKRVRDARASGQQVDTADVELLNSIQNGLDASSTQIVNKILNTPFIEGSTSTYSSELGTVVAKRVAEFGQAQAKALIEGVAGSDKSPSLLLFQKAQNEAVLEGGKSDVYFGPGGSNIVRQGVLMNTLGASNYELMMQAASPEARTARDRALISIALDQVMMGESKSVQDSYSKMGEDATPSSRKGVLDGTIAVLHNAKTMPNNQVVNAHSTLFSDENKQFIASLKQSEQIPNLVKLLDPRIIKGLKAHGDPALIRQMTSWAGSSANQVLRTQIADAQRIIQNSPNTTLAYNKDTGQIELKKINDTRSDLNPVQRALTGATEAFVTSPQQESRVVKDINTVFNAIDPILKETDGVVPNDVKLRMMQAMGLDFDTPKEGPLAGKLFRWVNNNIGGDPDRRTPSFVSDAGRNELTGRSNLGGPGITEELPEPAFDLGAPVDTENPAAKLADSVNAVTKQLSETISIMKTLDNTDPQLPSIVDEVDKLSVELQTLLNTGKE